MDGTTRTSRQPGVTSPRPRRCGPTAGRQLLRPGRWIRPVAFDTRSRFDYTSPMSNQHGRMRWGPRENRRLVRTYTRVAVGLLITALFLWLAVRNVDLAAVGEELRGADYWFL